MRHLLIRADASTAIGSGHIMRCLALAQAWQERGGCVTFLSHCQNEALRRWIVKEGFEFVFVERPHPDPADLKKILERLKNSPYGSDFPWLVLDGYHFDSNYQKSIRETGSRLVVIDDYNHLPDYHADIIINQNIRAEMIPYKCDLKKTVKLLGPKYVLFRTEFLTRNNIFQKQYEDHHRILVTFGGSDPYNITSKVLRALLQMPLNGYMIDVIVGPANPHVKHLEFEIKKAMKASVSPANSIQLHRSINMPDIMAMTDVAIVAGGSTCWELCFLGKPFIVLIAAENQHDIGHGLDDAGMAICLGWHEDVSLNKIKTSLKKLLYNTAIRRALSAKGRKIVDGLGRYRVMDAICKSD